jgi:MerR family transcriptional regulator/heat shock protein HspR
MVERKGREKRKYLFISAVAERFEIHPQTLRVYEREGLIRPHRSEGNTRLYDEESIKRLETILFLTRELGVNLAGVEVILNMREQLDRMRQEVDEALERARRELVERRGGVRPEHALVRVEPRSLIRRGD